MQHSCSTLASGCAVFLNSGGASLHKNAWCFHVTGKLRSCQPAWLATHREDTTGLTCAAMDLDMPGMRLETACMPNGLS